MNRHKHAELTHALRNAAQRDPILRDLRVQAAEVIEGKSYAPPLGEGMKAVPCALMTDPTHPQHNFLFIPHVDQKWVTALNLPGFSRQIVDHYLAEFGELDERGK